MQVNESRSSDSSKDGTDSAVCRDTTSCLSASLLAQQIPPPLPSYSGNDPDDESF